MYLYLTQYHEVLQLKNVVVVTQLQTLINLAAHAFNWHTWVQKKLGGFWLDQLPHIQLAFVCLRFNELKHSSFCTATEKASINEQTSLSQTTKLMSVLCRSSASLEFCTLKLEKFPIQIILTSCERLNKWEFELDLFKVHLHSVKTLQNLRLKPTFLSIFIQNKFNNWTTFFCCRSNYNKRICQFKSPNMNSNNFKPCQCTRAHKS